MKTKIIYSATLSLIITLLFSSCSFLLNERASLTADGFSKRKYYNYPTSKHSIEAKLTNKHSSPFNQTVTEKITAEKEIPAEEKTVIASSEEMQPAFSLPENKASFTVKHPAKTFIQNKITTEFPPISLTKIETHKTFGKNTVHPATSGSNAILVLELLLALILPPLAVVVHSGKVGKWFWITLLLCLGGGVFFYLTYSGAGVLFWAIAALIAICYVFGTIKD